MLLLGLAGSLDFIGRYIFSTANDAIKHDLHLSDATIGLLSGTASAVLFSVAIIPCALISDRGFAARLSAGGIALLSLATASMGATVGVASLAASRVGTGLGNAMFSPSSAALNAAYSRPERRSTAFGVSYAISYLGPIVGLAGGGFLVEHIGWRATFASAGLIGLPLAVLLGRFVREPQLPPAIGAGGNWRALAGNRALRDLLLFSLFSGVTSYGFNLWAVSFYMRSFGLSDEAASAWFGFGSGLAQVAGVLAGGFLADAVRRRRGFRGAMFFTFVAYLLSTALGVVQVSTHSLALSLAAMIVSGLFGGLFEAPFLAAVPSVVPPHQRAMAQALSSLAFIGTGLAVGPALFGAVSDALTPRYGADALQMSLLIAAVLSFWPAVHLLALARRRDGEVAGPAITRHIRSPG